MDAYRTPAVIEPVPLPTTCVPERAVPPSPWRHLPPALAKALAVATTLFLLVSSASLAAVAWTMVTARRPAVERLPLAQLAMPAPVPVPVPHAARPAPPAHPAPAHAASMPPLRHPRYRAVPSALALLGPAETHDVDQLWSRAMGLRSHASMLSLSRADMPLRALSPEALAQDRVRVVRWTGTRGASGLRVAEVGAGSPVARAGLRRGDLISGVNGYALNEPGALLHAWDAAATARAAVLEIDRPGTGPLVLRIDFSS